ncbi:hypothetical protein FQN52_002343 [Onygenales sp. PD_12]|nr:hypothetical protein FQN52_002343 [Onygenales sp. PD_12]
MTSNTPEEALHFRGKTLTPESPRPLHVSEPTAIPVLQYQTDPAFNDTAAYQKTSDIQTPPPEPEAAVSAQIRLARYTFSMLHNDVGDPGPGAAGAQDTSSFAGSFEMGFPQTETENESACAATQIATSSSHFTSPVLESSSLKVTPSATSLSVSVSETSLPLDRPIPSELFPSEPCPDSTISRNDYTSRPQEETNAFFAENARSIGGGHDKKVQTEASHTPEGDATLQKPLNTQSMHIPISATAVINPTTSTDDHKTLPPASEPSHHPLPAGLPPRPPPQEKPSIHPYYSATDNIHSFHPLPNQHENDTSQYAQSNLPQPSGLSLPPAPARAPGTSSTAKGLPPPPIATFQKLPPSSSIQSTSAVHNPPRGDRLEKELRIIRGEGDREAPWAPEIQKKYDDFLRDERIYVTEGLWDRFQPGSRLFVGNLPTERVTKRDLFHLFHHYGTIGQISIKQAYGFVQFLEPESCRRALDAEQGGVILKYQNHKERLEMFRGTNLAEHRLREDLDHQSMGEACQLIVVAAKLVIGMIDHLTMEDRFSLSNLETATRPTAGVMIIGPAALPLHVAFADRPIVFGIGHRRFTIGAATDAVLDLGLGLGPLLDVHRDIEVQVQEKEKEAISVTRICPFQGDPHAKYQMFKLDFVYHVENSFRDRGLPTDVLILSPRIPLSAVVRRQIIEGVMAIVKLSRVHQYSRKIPLQVFDRSNGIDNVRFNGEILDTVMIGLLVYMDPPKLIVLSFVEYSELDLNIAAEVVLHARNVQHSSTSNRYLSTQAPPVPQIPPAPQNAFSQPPSGTSDIANLISNLDGPALQSLLRTLQNNPAALQAAQQQYAPPGNPTDLASMLTNAPPPRTPTFPPATTTNKGQPLASAYGVPPTAPTIPPDANLASLLAQSLGGQPTQPPSQPVPQMPPQMPSQIPPHVQSIMDQLMKWKQ